MTKEKESYTIKITYEQREKGYFIGKRVETTFDDIGDIFSKVMPQVKNDLKDTLKQSQKKGLSIRYQNCYFDKPFEAHVGYIYPSAPKTSNTILENYESYEIPSGIVCKGTLEGSYAYLTKAWQAVMDDMKQKQVHGQNTQEASSSLNHTYETYSVSPEDTHGDLNLCVTDISIYLIQVDRPLTLSDSTIISPF
mmetsp:Transcript_13890/g.21017  ORF Transcript_13890/g.21017 Transcript_13890/m.21017 type:complete len:194 (+) Transcript_13890:1342-1923(+)